MLYIYIWILALCNLARFNELYFRMQYDINRTISMSTHWKEGNPSGKTEMITDKVTSVETIVEELV